MTILDTLTSRGIIHPEWIFHLYCELTPTTSPASKKKNGRDCLLPVFIHSQIIHLETLSTLVHVCLYLYADKLPDT